MSPRGDAYAARIRAAISYADKDRDEIGDALRARVGEGSPETVSRLMSGKKVSDEKVREVIADACDVPLWFLEHGFDPAAAGADPTLAEEVEALRRQMDVVLHVLAIRAGSSGASGAGQQGQHGGPTNGEGTGPRT